MGLLLAARGARAQSFGGALNYTGALGPVGNQKPLCVCLYTDAALNNSIGCLILRRNDTTYHVAVGNRSYYAIAFLDLHINERHDADEPYEIFSDRAAAPGVAIDARENPTGIDFVLGDENLPGSAPTETPTTTPHAATPTATPAAAAGDCDGDGRVTVAELVSAVAIALDARPLSDCPPADRDGDGAVRIEELVAALTAALDAP
ncbi:MAG: EF-hand domain-containing protein [Deltaproteobacteria bacterium]|nr:EF-hand domain-containing protein [Deltaproteobacteria bacterium]